MKTHITKNMTAQSIVKGVANMLLVAIACLGALAPAHAQRPGVTKARTQYQVSDLPSFGGTSSGGNSINDLTWVSGYSRLPNRNRHGTLWRNGLLNDRGTLRGPSGRVAGNVKNAA